MFSLFFGLLLGLLCLVAGAELLVRGGGQLALALRVPALVVGLTIVAFGTSMPELMVSITAARNASTEMALANVNGSNIANITLVLGLAALVAPLRVDRTVLHREIPICVVLTLLVILMTYFDQRISRGEGISLLLIGVAYNGFILWEALQGRAPAPEIDDPDHNAGLVKHGLLLVVGLVILVVGAQLFVWGAVKVAEMLHISDRFIGLTVVALGTSAPEVATGMVSAYRGEVDLAVGNSLGSNLLNIAMVLGVTAMIEPIVTKDSGTYTDMYVGLGATLLLALLVRLGRLGRVEGALLVLGYLSYMYASYFVGGPIP